MARRLHAQKSALSIEIDAPDRVRHLPKVGRTSADAMATTFSSVAAKLRPAFLSLFFPCYFVSTLALQVNVELR
jgi:hypothetical protein